MRFKGTIVITDPCYLDNGMPEIPGVDWWDSVDYGDNLGAAGFTDFISESTLYGDWSCFTYKGTKEEISDKILEWDRYYFHFFNEYNTTENPKTKEILLEEYKAKKAEFEKKNVLGSFCADAGMVCVVYLDEILAFNPKFKKWAEEHDWCATIIEDFDGDVEYVIDNDEAHIQGIGNINFYTSQSGF